MTIYLASHTIPRPASLGGGNWTIHNLVDITVVLGKNGSGKSLLLRSWRDQNIEGVHYVAPERTGEMTYQAHLLQDEIGAERRRSSSTRNFVPDYRQRIVGRTQSFFMTRGNYRGEGVAPGDPAELERFLETLIPDFAVKLVPGLDPYQLTRLATGERVSQVDQLSSGEAQLLTMGLDILTIAAMWEIEERAQRILLIDEPDAHIHPDLQARFADFVLRLCDRFLLQIVIATHSTSLLSALGQFGDNRAAVVYMERTVSEYSARAFSAVTKEIASVLGGHVLMGPLFGAPLLLVEGNDDYRIWGQVPRHHVINLAVLPTNGDEIRRYQLALERTMASLREPTATPIGYALLDGDKSLPTANPDNPQKHIRFIRLHCREAENLYLTQEVLSQIGLSPQEAIEKLTNNAERFGAHSETVSKAASWDRRGMDLKQVVGEVAQVLDPRGLPWTQRLGMTIGRAVPTGELADFLGDEVLQALWPKVPNSF